MGQATVDLPDPMGPPPATAGGTDELLAQLAGEEIDRLLAEADAEHAAGQKNGDGLPSPDNRQSESAAPDTASAGSPLADAADAELSAQLDNLFADLTVNAPDSPQGEAGESRPPAEGAKRPTVSTDAQPAVTADDLLASAAPTSPATDIALLPAEPVAATPAAPVHPVEEELRETEALEREARAAAPAVENQEDTLTSLASEDARPLPIFLRPLEWLNAPLDACPEAVRDIVGKIAILTTINAVSILVYVFFVRRH